MYQSICMLFKVSLVQESKKRKKERKKITLKNQGEM